jgi:hypothetical protein
MWLRRQRLQKLVAGLLTVTTGVSTDAAVLVHAGVLATFIATDPARQCARLHLLAQKVRLGAVEAGEHTPCGDADVGAIVVQADTTNQHLHHLLAKTGIGANVAGLGAGVTLFNTPDQYTHIDLG